VTQNGLAQADGLLSAVSALRDEVAKVGFPLDLPDAPAARATSAELLHQLDDYVLPRLRSLDAPILAAIGGSTGAGKSTLVNSLVGHVVSKSGVLRPTTSSPVLVHHPDDERWFLDDRVLPGLSRVTGEVLPDAPQDPSSVRIVPSSALPPGLALLDAPDIDSVVSANRTLAAQLLSAADLWIFVTTAARYADAVPWALLRQASERGTSIAIVLDRAPTAAVEEVRVHLGSMLRRQGLGGAPIFTILESHLDRDGLLPPVQTERLRGWLTALAHDSHARADIVRQTLAGALDSLDGRAAVLADASTTQVTSFETLRHDASTAYADASRAVHRGMSDGTLLRGEVLARWQEYVGTGEFFRQVETTVSRVRDRVTAMLRGVPAPTKPLGEALQTGAAALVLAEAENAATTAARSWRTTASGDALIDDHPELAAASPDLGPKVARVVRDWQGQILDLVRTEGKDRRTAAKTLAYGVNGVGVILMLVTFASTGGVTGAEAGIAGGSALLAQKLLEAIFGDEAVRRLAGKARQALVTKVEQLYDDELVRYFQVLDAVAVPREQSRALRAAAEAVRVAR
jgi:energy-coupling factor transporter ATP-binding protein EcfA2